MAVHMYVDAAAGGGGTGLSWAQAWNLAEFEADVEGAAVADDYYYLKEGTYTLTNAFSTTRDGSTQYPAHIIGVVSATTNEPPTTADWATGDNRPLIAGGAHGFVLDNSWNVRNLRFTGSHATVLRLDTNGRAINCKVTNSGTGQSFATGGNGVVTWIDCESDCSSTGDSFEVGSGYTIGCFAKDGDSGFVSFGTAAPGAAIFCIASGCNEGANLSTSSHPLVLNTVFFDCTDGILATTSHRACVLSCIFNDCGDGASWSTDYSAGHWFDYNNWEGNTDDVDFVTKGPNATAVDPLFTNAAGDDFSLQAGSSCIDAGFNVLVGVG